MRTPLHNPGVGSVKSACLSLNLAMPKSHTFARPFPSSSTLEDLRSLLASQHEPSGHTGTGMTSACSPAASGERDGFTCAGSGAWSCGAGSAGHPPHQRRCSAPACKLSRDGLRCSSPEQRAAQSSVMSNTSQAVLCTAELGVKEVAGRMPAAAAAAAGVRGGRSGCAGAAGRRGTPRAPAPPRCRCAAAQGTRPAGTRCARAAGRSAPAPKQAVKSHPSGQVLPASATHRACAAMNAAGFMQQRCV